MAEAFLAQKSWLTSGDIESDGQKDVIRQNPAL
jgi:hypothetical protein